MQIVILAGGFATRLKPLSNNLPKSLVQINGKPFIYYQLKYFVNLGFDRFVFCLGHLSDQLVNYLNSISEWKDYFTYSIEKEPLGTGGAIINAYSFLEEDFLIINGDNIFLGNYIPAINYYYSSKIKSLIFLRKVKNNGNVMFNRDNKQINLYKRDCSKCLYEDIGVKIFNKRIFEQSKDDLPISLEDNVYKNLIDKNNLYGILMDDEILDIGSHKAIEETNKYFTNKIN